MQNTKIDRREALKTIGAVAMLPLLPSLQAPRIEPLVPQPFDQPSDGQYWDENMNETGDWWLFNLDETGYPVFWDFPEWANDYELIDGVWCWF